MPRITGQQASEALSAASAEIARPLAVAAEASLKAQIARVKAHLRAGDTAAAREEASALSPTQTLRRAKRKIASGVFRAADLGTALVDDPETSIWSRGAPYPPELSDSVPEFLLNAFERTLERSIKPRLLRRIEEAIRGESEAIIEGITKVVKFDTADLAKQINRFMAGEIKRVVDVSANLVGTRVAAYGTLHEARVRGIQKYRIDAVLDERTSKICQEMNGREFEVEQAFVQTQEVLKETDPAQVIKKAPFVDATTLAEMQMFELDSAELAAKGFSVPPFHFLCRSVVTLIENQVVPEAGLLSPRITVGEVEDYSVKVFDQTVRFTMKGVRPNYSPAMLDVGKVDAAWRQGGERIDSTTQIGNRREVFEQFLRDNPNKRVRLSEIGGFRLTLWRDEAGEPARGADGLFRTVLVPEFEDGRHRFSVFRDQGVKALPIAVADDVPDDVLLTFAFFGASDD